MGKKLVVLALAVVAILGAFAFTGCDLNSDLPRYKAVAERAIQDHADTKIAENGYTEQGLEAIATAVVDGKKAVNNATARASVTIERDKAIQAIDDVPKKDGGAMEFPSVLEGFDLEEFTDEFFENYTLVLVPFEWGSVLYEYLDFYTVFVDNGKLNFFIEITYPYFVSDSAMDYRLFAVIIPNEIFSKYEIGECVIFKTYEFHSEYEEYEDGERVCNEYITENCRDGFKEIKRKSVEHRVSYVFSGYFPSHNNPIYPKKWIYEITLITSMSSLSEYF